MKMHKNDYEALRRLVFAHPLPATAADYAEQGLSRRRWLFDQLWHIPQKPRQEWFDRGIYMYLNDDHILTALSRICAERDQS